MGAATYLPLTVSFLMWLTGPQLARRLPPSTAVRLLTFTALVTALGTAFVLAVAGFVVLAQVGPVAAHGHWSASTLRNGDSIPTPVGVVAGAAVLALLVAVSRRVVESVRDLAATASLCRSLPAAVDGLVVWHDDRPEAFCLPGLRGRVVVSTAMLRALPVDERRVLLAHEAAHLRFHHLFYSQSVDLAAAANPLLRTTAVAVHAASERWADEAAAADVGDRQLAARALARAALARARAPQGALAGSPIPATALEASGAGVPERARALLAPSPPRRRLLALAVTALVLVTTAAVAETARDTEAGFEQAHSSFVAAK